MSKGKSKIVMLNLLIALENVLGVHRNFFSLDKRFRWLAVVRVVCTAIVYLIIQMGYIISAIDIYDGMVKIYAVIFSILSIAISVANFFDSILQSVIFLQLIEKINTVHEFCKLQTAYSESLRELSKKIIIRLAMLLTSCTAILIIQLVEIRFYHHSVSYMYVVDTLYTCLTVLLDFQFYIELMIFDTLIVIIKSAMKQIKVSLTSSLEKIDACHVESLDIDKFLNEVENVVPVYNSLSRCGDNLKRCFGSQVVLSLLSLTLFYIFLGYFGVFIIMKMRTMESIKTEYCILILIRLLNYMSAIVGVLQSGQEAHNTMEDLLRSTARLNSVLLKIPGPEAKKLQKSVKSFHRQMKTEPVRVSVLARSPVQMALLLQILSAIVSYTIIALQFNHVF